MIPPSSIAVNVVCEWTQRRIKTDVFFGKRFAKMNLFRKKNTLVETYVVTGLSCDIDTQMNFVSSKKNS